MATQSSNLEMERLFSLSDLAFRTPILTGFLSVDSWNHHFSHIFDKVMLDLIFRTTVRLSPFVAGSVVVHVQVV